METEVAPPRHYKVRSDLSRNLCLRLEPGERFFLGLEEADVVAVGEREERRGGSARLLGAAEAGSLRDVVPVLLGELREALKRREVVDVREAVHVHEDVHRLPRLVVLLADSRIRTRDSFLDFCSSRLREVTGKDVGNPTRLLDGHLHWAWHWLHASTHT